MRENRTHGSEGGEGESLSRPLSTALCSNGASGFKKGSNRISTIDTTDCGVPVSALLSSASMHDSLAAMPLAMMTAERVTNCYDLMDAAYCSSVLRDHSRSLGHVPLIDHNPRKGEKIEFAPSGATLQGTQPG